MVAPRPESRTQNHCGAETRGDSGLKPRATSRSAARYKTNLDPAQSTALKADLSDSLGTGHPGAKEFRYSGCVAAAVKTWELVVRRVRVPLGFLLAAAFLYLARPSWLSLGIGALVAVPGLALRAAAAGHVKKNEELTRTGPYAYTRNPLYLGSILMALGFAIAGQNIWIGAALVAFFLAIYLPVIRSEENWLRGAFPEFEEYAKRVPRLFPRFTASESGSADGAAAAPTRTFNAAQYRKHREYNALIGSILLWAALAAKIVFRVF